MMALSHTFVVCIKVTEIWEAKIADFGGSKRIATLDQTLLTKKYIGTTRWAAPEVLSNEDYDEKIDVFRYACKSLSLSFRSSFKDACPSNTRNKS
jgi:serine/threonine protein kinase